MSWRDRIHDRKLPYDVDSLTETMRELFNDMEMEMMIDLTCLGRVNPVHLAVVLRASNEATTLGWNAAVETARLACVEDGLDPNDVLYGML